MEAIGSISNMAVPNYEWTPILYKKEKKWSELIKDEKELLFHGKLDVINKVLKIASKFTGLDENVLLNIDNDKKNKYCGIIGAYLRKYHNVTEYTLVYNYGASKNIYYLSKNYTKLMRNPKYRMLFNTLLDSHG